MKLHIREYLTADGKSPYREWLRGLDVAVRARVQARILRFELGNLGDHKALGDGVWEARLAFGAGYRVYFGRHEGMVVLLLTGGDKGSQRRDIQIAKQSWANFQEANRHGTSQ